MSAPRRWVWRGTVEAGALRIERSRLGEVEARRRVLAIWEPGLRVLEAGPDWLVELPGPRRIRVDEALGAPLLREAGTWAELPLDDRQRVRAMVRTGELVFARGGAVVSRAPGSAVDPGGWLELGAFSEVRLAPLSSPPPEVVEIVARGPDPGDYGIGPPSDEAEDLLHALRRGTEADRPWWIGPLKTLLSWMPGMPSAGGSAPGGRGPENAVAPSPSWLERMLTRLRLDLILGAQASRLVRQLLDQLDGDDLEAALRRAIPLGGVGGGGGFSIPWSLPFRGDLSVGPRGAAGGVGIAVGEGLYGMLRQAYERAAERLERAGKIEQAAYVLAELLDRADDAVALCERHGRYALAARVAELRRLAPEVAIRLWVLAGDVERATDLALLSNAWAAALYRLEQDRPDVARLLRVRWGSAMASAGKHTAALDLLEPLGLSSQALTEIADAGIAAGGPSAGDLAVRRLAWSEDPGARDHLEALLADRSDERGDERVGALVALSARDVDRALHRIGLRVLLREECSRGGMPDVRRGLLARADDLVLRSDLPTEALPEPERLDDRTRPLEVEVEPSGGGPAILAIRALSDGGFAAALGDVGLRLLDARGRPRCHLDQPVRALVHSTDRTRLLALERPDGPGRVWRIDPFTGRSVLWGELDLAGHAPYYDGLIWAVATGDRVRLLDAQADRPRSLWAVPMQGVQALRPAGTRMWAVAEGTLWTWRTTEREPRLERREELPQAPAWHAVGHDGAVAWVDVAGPALNVGSPTPLELPLTDDRVEAWEVAPCGSSWRVRGLVWEPEARVVELRVVARRASSLHEILRVRCPAGVPADDPGDRWLLVGTADGQVLKVDLRSGRRRRYRL